LEGVVAKFDPSVLAVDYDLSPGCIDLDKDPNPAPGNCGAELTRDIGARRQLDDYLRSLKSLVLIRPLPVEDMILCGLRRDWENGMRRAGVVFGESDLIHNRLFDVIVKYEDPPLSSPWRSFARQAHDVEAARRRSTTLTAAELRTCDTREQVRTREVRRADLHPLNFHAAARSVRTCELRTTESLAQCFSYYGRGFPVVFVGADDGSGDLFHTPIGPKPGVVLHAYSTFSMTHPLRTFHVLALVIDALIGTFTGLLLHRSWGTYAEYGPAERLRRAVWSLLIVVGASGVPLVTARILMAWGLWINPGPMLVGLYFDSWHASLGESGRARSRRDRAVTRLRFVGWVVVVGLAVANPFVLRLFEHH
jgi:hypothetical protein